VGFFSGITRVFGKRHSGEQTPYWQLSHTRRERLSYWVCHAGIYYGYLLSLQQDHEPDEIDEAMMSYKFLMQTKAKMAMHDMRSNELYLDSLSAEERDAKVFDMLTLLEKYPEAADSGIYDVSDILKEYLTEYGRPHDLEKRLFEAEVTNRRDLVNLYRKYV
jgi:hypothetical protein